MGCGSGGRRGILSDKTVGSGFRNTPTSDIIAFVVFVIYVIIAHWK